MPIDPRTLEDEQVGTRLRDGAVDARTTDFLAPTNAGEDNPHGPTVVNPGLHALQDVRPVLAGAVSADPATQDAAEDAHLTEWHPGTAAPDEGDE